MHVLPAYLYYENGKYVAHLDSKLHVHDAGLSIQRAILNTTEPLDNLFIQFRSRLVHDSLIIGQSGANEEGGVVILSGVCHGREVKITDGSFHHFNLPIIEKIELEIFAGRNCTRIDARLFDSLYIEIVVLDKMSNQNGYFTATTMHALDIPREGFHSFTVPFHAPIHGDGHKISVSRLIYNLQFESLPSNVDRRIRIEMRGKLITGY